MSEIWTTGDGLVSVTVNEMLTPDAARGMAEELLLCAAAADDEAAS